MNISINKWIKFIIIIINKYKYKQINNWIKLNNFIKNLT